MTKKGDPNPVVMLDSFQHLVKIFSAFGRRTFHPRPKDGVFRCDLNKFWVGFFPSCLNTFLIDAKKLKPEKWKSSFSSF
jgi:hypothetical protein